MSTRVRRFRQNHSDATLRDDHRDHACRRAARSRHPGGAHSLPNSRTAAWSSGGFPNSQQFWRRMSPSVRRYWQDHTRVDRLDPAGRRTLRSPSHAQRTRCRIRAPRPSISGRFPNSPEFRSKRSPSLRRCDRTAKKEPDPFSFSLLRRLHLHQPPLPAMSRLPL